MAATIEIPMSDGPMAALSTEPDGPARGAVLVIQEAFGLTDHIGSVCDRLADAGWRALALGCSIVAAVRSSSTATSTECSR